MPAIAFFSGHPPSAIKEGDPQWHTRLPMNRHAVRQGPPSNAGPTYGRYFNAIADFLKQDGMAIITTAGGRLLNRTVGSKDIRRIDVHLIKHGAFYHPAKIVAFLDDAAVPMILNVAAGFEGQRALPDEYLNLQRLSGEHPDEHLIDVYGWGKGRTGYQVEELMMFLGQWLEGFYEFHMTGGQDGSGQWQVWDTDLEFRNLSPHQVNALYLQAATILATYYQPLTFEAILDWHHAAGDFVIRPTANGIDVRLITVRRYEPLIQWNDPQPPSVEDLLETITLFILRTSMFMRLDRLDGVGAHAWADTEVLPSICKGLSNGLAITADRNGLPQTVIEAAWAFLSAHSKSELLHMGMNIIDKWKAASTEKDFLAEQLSAHIDELCNIL